MNTQALDSQSGSDYSMSEADEPTRKRQKSTKPTQRVRRMEDEDDTADAAIPFIDLSQVNLRRDHKDRPIWIEPRRKRIVLESFSPGAQEAQRFITSIAEPVSRPSHIHEFKLTEQSLLSAQSVGHDAEAIIEQLDLFCKTDVPDEIKTWIRDTTKSFGKIKLLLKHNHYYVQSPDHKALQRVLHDPVIAGLKIEGTELSSKEKKNQPALMIPGTKDSSKDARFAQQQAQSGMVRREEDEAPGDNMMATLRAEEEGDFDDEDEDESEQIHSFEIAQESVEKVKRRCLEIKLPIMEEYDFRNDLVNYNLDIDLKPAARIRNYQEDALTKMFGNGRARSGIIVLPCGAGKTLVGITAACTIKKGVVILCTSAMSVTQWRNELIKWTNINPDHIACFTAENKEWFRDKTAGTGVIISTYSMIAERSRRAHDTQKFLDEIKAREWGITLLDEVHVVPADMFRKVSSSIKTHSKLGLTATLLREDDKISDLNYLIGPKLFEANWMELSEQGHIARVQCAEVWCPMSSEFYAAYLGQQARKRMLFYTMNPRKFQACQFLIDYHEKRGDKIIVFADNVFTLRQYARHLMKPFIDGETPNHERQKVLDNFQNNPAINTIFLSKVGDTSLDLPEATCLIQVSSHYGSRRQEAQRLGRILRAKRRNDEGFNAFFYSLVSKDTDEMMFSAKRQAFLVDQGYAFKVITHLQGLEGMRGLMFADAKARMELLEQVMLQVEKNDASMEIEAIGDDLFARRRAAMAAGKGGPMVRRTAGLLGELSGGQNMAYMEYARSRNKDLAGKGKGGHNAFIKKIKRDNDRRREAAKDIMDG